MFDEKLNRSRSIVAQMHGSSIDKDYYYNIINIPFEMAEATVYCPVLIQ